MEETAALETALHQIATVQCLAVSLHHVPHPLARDPLVAAIARSEVAIVRSEEEAIARSATTVP